jgi:alkylation response protein AidB-like acyl-CoA dehydrogenase
MTDVLVPPSQKPGSPLASEQEAREVAEAARETEWEAPSFVRELFEGSFRLDLVHPFPAPDAADLERARPFMERLERFMRERVDSDMIDREGKIPSYIVKGLGDLGAFGIKIPTEYGGLGLSQYSYTRAIGLVTSQDGNLTALLSAAQSIGVPTPLKLFGTPEQKKRYLPRLARAPFPPSRSPRTTSAPTPPAWKPRRRCRRTARTTCSTVKSFGAPTAPSPR